ncbi:MAG: 5-methyltetrahydropteroyltriglutamate--homocysteine S-methyltransferase [Chloroflexota bacterium]|nr:5-methyltetrahydropteroyltriglutamate--homocysteine S-methyltransferase [Chloroflexota bacterium]
MTATYRADHVGSLLRPRAVMEGRQAHGNGEISAEKLRHIEDAAILEALEGQRKAGLQIFTDGELRRGSWITDMAEAVDGFVRQSRTIEWHGPQAGREASTSQVVGGKLRARRRLTENQSAFLKQHAPGACKMTVPAPSNFYIVGYAPGVTDAAYSSRDELMVDVVGIVRREVEGLIAEGFEYIQMDSPFYGAFIDEHERQRLREAGLDPDEGLEKVVAADNAALQGLGRAGLTLGLHICRGNSRSRWLYEGGYDHIAEKLFGGLDVDAFLLEYDSPREGTFEPLRFVPKGKTVVLGLVNTKEPKLESPDELGRRIDEAARYVPLEQLTLSPQCGFASVAAGNLISEDDQWRKLELVVETAQRVWG